MNTDIRTDTAAGPAETGIQPVDTALADIVPPAAAPTDRAQAGPIHDEPPLFDAALCHAIGEQRQIEGDLAEAETYYRAALALDPARPMTWANLGLAATRAGRAEEGLAHARQAMRLDPFNVEAMNNLGIAAHGLNAMAEAENHFRGVLRLRPDHPGATLNLGVVRQHLGHPAEAEMLYRRALDLGCDAPRVQNNLAMVLAELLRLEEAEQAARDALAAAPDYPEAEVNLALILLMRGRLREAWPRYEARWRVPPLSLQPRLPAETRLTGNEDVVGKKVLLLAEQGFGDTLQFCRYAPILAAVGAEVTLAVPNGLVRSMQSLPGVRVIGEDEPVPEHDFHCPLLSLPKARGTDRATIPASVPYLAADPDAVTAWEALLPSRRDCAGPRVGLVWAGGRRPAQPLADAIDKRRSMPLSALAPLADVPGVVFVSLQAGPEAKQAETVPFPLIDLTDRLTDFADTAALIQTLDLTIAVDTAVAHLAGALGQPVWLLNRFDACWRWLPGEGDFDRVDTPWYPTMRLFRQPAPGDWGSVVARVAAALPGFRVLG